MLLIFLAQPGFGVDGLKSHEPHQALNPLVIDLVPLLMQGRCHAADPVKGGERVLLIDQTHEVKIDGRHLLRLVIPAGARQTQQLALLRNRKNRMIRLNELAFSLRRQVQTFF